MIGSLLPQKATIPRHAGRQTKDITARCQLGLRRGLRVVADGEFLGQARRALQRDKPDSSGLPNDQQNTNLYPASTNTAVTAIIRVELQPKTIAVRVAIPLQEQRPMHLSF